jgi:excisionase family DNA binding protein
VAEHDGPILLRLPEVAELIACSRSKTYELAARGDLPGVVRIGGSVRVHRPTLLGWLAGEANGKATLAVAKPSGAEEGSRDARRSSG